MKRRSFPNRRPDPGPSPLPGQISLFPVPREVRRLKPGPAIPSYGTFELESPPGPATAPPARPALAPEPCTERS